ncbi:amino acid adenylation domain-containing protein [Streptomyces sp. NPDC056045]|uniref:amino acid adenylation domain-containing protein n=1 Tax=Streptomyces sp. NPDC056045 TaxID=3345691 RepID=UPI0035E078E1
MSSRPRPDITGVHPLSPAQAGMLFHRLLDGHDNVYLTQERYRLTGPLDVALFRAAWQRVADRHDALRTALVWKDLDQPLQAVRAGMTVPWEEIDLRDLPAEQQRERTAALMENQRGAGLDPATEPPIALTVVRLGDESHDLLWTSQHLVLDGWSVALVLREVLACYRESVDGTPAVLSEPVPHARYLEWLASQDPAGPEQYWRDRLAGFASPVALSLPNPPLTSPDGAPVRVPFSLTREESDRLRAFARTHRVTLSTLLEGAWALTLSTFSGEHDVVFGAVRNGRLIDLADAGEIVGMLVNTVPVRVGVDPSTPVGAWLTGLHRELDGQRDHEHTSLTDIQGWSDVPRPQSLFDSIVTVQSLPSLDAEDLPPGLTVELLQTWADSGYETALVVHPAAEVAGELVCRADTVDPGTGLALVSVFARLLDEIGRAPQTPIGALGLVAGTDLPLLDTAFRAPAPEGAVRPVLDLIADRIRETPEAPAVIWGEEGRLGYAELDRLADAWADELAARGAGPERPVGICFPRSPELVVAMLAVLRAGAAYVPIDPDHPRQRRVDMIADTGTGLLLTTPVYAPRFTEHEDLDVVPLTLDAPVGQDGPRPRRTVDPRSLAYVCYTSGSTGTPKGVSVPHEALDWFVGTTGYVGVRPGEVVGMASSPSFDALAFEVWTALAHGASLRVVPHEVLLDPETLRARLAEWGVDIMYLTAALVEELSRHAPDFASGLRVLLFGGQAADPAAIARVSAASAPEALLQVYGPTETTIWSSVQSAAGGPHEFVPLGLPITRTTEYLLDADLRPVPPGMPGELYIGGEGVVRGYLGRPALTAERFLPDPFRPGRMYRTGDRARLLHDGRLEFLGRVDEQVKIRGFRVEPGEIAAVLREHPAVDAAVVGVRKDPQRGAVLVAHVVTRVSPDELREFAAARLPAYMVPTHCVRLDRLPLSVTGKVDKARLPGPEEAGGDAPSAGADGTPASPFEEAMAAVWARVLGVPEVGVTQSFFELGGHSLLAVRLVAALAADLDVETTVRRLFDAPTVRELAATIAEDGGTAPAREEIPRTRPGAPVPLSSGQSRLWTLQRMDPNSGRYNAPVALRLRGVLNLDALRSAVTDVVRRHDALRTRIGPTADGLVQTAAADAEVVVRLHDLTALPDGEREGRAGELLSVESERVFDLAADTLLRCSVVRLGTEDHLLLLTFHHIAWDGVSEAVIAAGLAERYGKALAHTADLTEPPRRTLADYAAWEHAERAAGRHAPELDHWRERLRDLPVLDLPVDRRRTLNRSSAAHAHAFAFTPGQTEVLTALGRKHGATPFMAFLAAFGVLMERHTGRTDLPVGSPVDLRDHPDLDGLVGFLVNTVVLRLDLSGGPSFPELLGRVRSTVLDAHAHRRAPFDLVVEELNPTRESGRSPLFDVFFQYSPAPADDWALPGLAVERARIAPTTCDFDIEVELIGRPDGGTDAQLLCSADLFDGRTVRSLAERFVLLAERICADPARPVGRLDVLRAEDRSDLAELAAGRPEAVAAADTATGLALRLDEAVARHAGEAADRPAVTHGATRLTYGELRQSSERLAARLRERGIGRGDVVGLWAERHPETVVAILAILRAGAAYLPLEPSDPADRIAFLLHDRQCAAVLTTQGIGRVPENFRHLALTLDDGPAPEPVPAAVEPLEERSEHDLAYVIYTSGSTGRPKAVGVEHHSVSHYAAVTAREYGLTGDDRVLQCSSFSFDAFVSELWTTLVAGATLVLPADRMLSPDGFLGDLAATGTTVVDMPTAFWHQLCAWLADVPGAKVPGSLRLVVIGGEQANAGHLAQWHAAVGDRVRLINSYGPTEATCVVTHADLTDATAWHPDTREVPIGRPLPGTRAYLLDEDLRPVPPGATGALYVAGPQLARGYLGAPALTAQVFLPDPWGPAGSRMYRTGDIARLGPDGRIQVLGRADGQVKVRGFRVELGEVERALAAFPGLRSAAAAVRTHPESGNLLVGYVVPVEGRGPDLARVRAFLRERLPRHCVPDALVVLDALPLTNSRKVDRKALPDPADAVRPEDPQPELTDAERLLADIWLGVLPRSTVAPGDRFFDIGGHSLALARVGARLRGELGIDVPLTVLYERPTLAEQALAVEAAVQAEIDAMSESEVRTALGGEPA